MPQQDLGATFDAIANALNSVLGRVGASINRIFEGVSKAVNAAANAQKAFQDALDSSEKAQLDYQAALLKSAEAAKKAAQSNDPKDILAAKQAAFGARMAGKDAQEAQKNADSSAPSALGNLATVMSGAAAAFTAAIAAVQQVISQLQKFVEALAPQTIAEFQRRLNDLFATIGVAFTPIFEMLRGAFIEIAGILLPVMQQLKPVVESLTESFISSLIPTVRVLATVLEALIPVLNVFLVVTEALSAMLRPVIIAFEFIARIIGTTMKLFELALLPVIVLFKIFAAVMDSLSEVMHILDIVFKTIVQTVEAFIKSLFGGASLSKVFDFLAKITMKVVEGMLVFIATLAKILGADNFVANLIKNLKEEGKGGATAAGQFSFQGFQEVNKQIALAAAQATGGSKEKKFDLGDVIKSLEEVQKGNSPLKFLEPIKVAVDAIRTAIAPGGPVTKAIQDFKDHNPETAAGIKGLIETGGLGLPGVAAGLLF